jgi:hypothetical protein
MTHNSQKLIQSVQDALNEANSCSLPDGILSIEGMSGAQFKRFINRLLSKEAVKSYLEIGIWKGSTSIAALFENTSRLKYTLIDNWSGFGGPYQEFIDNWKRFIGSEPPLINDDSFSIIPIHHGISEIDVYFYDGCHQENSQYLALKHYYESMSRSFVYLVDDWNWSDVKNGTNRAISDLKLNVAYKQEIEVSGVDYQGWYNGCGIFVLEKQ